MVIAHTHIYISYNVIYITYQTTESLPNNKYCSGKHDKVLHIWAGENVGKIENPILGARKGGDRGEEEERKAQRGESRENRKQIGFHEIIGRIY